MDIFPPSGNYSILITNQINMDISTCGIYSILIITNQMDRKSVSRSNKKRKKVHFLCLFGIHLFNGSSIQKSGRKSSSLNARCKNLD